MRICIDCGQEKELCHFTKVRSYKGKDYWTKFCKKCNWQRRKQKFFPDSATRQPYNWGQTNADTREKWNNYQREWARKRYWAERGKEVPEYDARTKNNIIYRGEEN